MTDISLDLFNAYFAARRNKRNTYNQLKFEYSYESNLLMLNDEIINKKYVPLPEIAFIVNKPVKREIFAADFRDRVVQHLLFSYINPIIDKYLINDCYSCRKGKGTYYGINRINSFIRSCSMNYKKDCYILKLDIQGYFMSINRTILFELINQILIKEKAKNKILPFDEDLVNYLLKTIIFNDTAKNCRIKGNKENWNDLPKNKSLFYASENCGLPIGNITSQLFGNIYMANFDDYVKRNLGIRYYGRYVDDFILIHPDKEYLKYLIPHLSNYLLQNLHLVLHPNKIYLQHYSKGVKFLGAVIKPNRIYIADRTKVNFYTAIEKQNSIVKEHKPTEEERNEFIKSMNSYLGIMKHYKSYKLRKGMLFKKLSGWWWNYVYLVGYEKFVMKRKKSL
jgi:RNA-directed DNA polymerase